MIFAGIYHSHDTKSNLADFIRHNADIAGIDKQFQNDFCSIYVGMDHALQLSSKYKVHMEKNFLVLGDIRSKSSYKPVKSNEEFLHIRRPICETIVKEFFGAYIAFEINEEEKEIKILRDPTGFYNLFYMIVHGMGVIFSNQIFLLYKLLNLRPSFNTSYLLSYFLFGNIISSADTAFQNINELHSGCILSLSKLQPPKVDLCWNPALIYKEKKHDVPQIAETLREILRYDAQDLSKLMLYFSGGLDSTSIIYCLKSIARDDQEIKAFNIFHPKISSSDETMYASKIAHSLDVPLIEFDCSNFLPFTQHDIPNFFPNKPNMSLINLKLEEHFLNITQQSKDTVFFSGEGGDYIFMAPPHVTSLADIILDKQFSLLIKKLKEMGTYIRMPLLTMLKTMIKNLLQYYTKKGYAFVDLSYYLSVDWLKSKYETLDKTLIHPFYNNKDTVYPGKFEQIDYLYNALTLVDDGIKRVYTKFPLLSQPILELALSIPTYNMYDCEYDRFIFRDSVSKLFNTDNVWRKYKGDFMAGTYALGLLQNKEHIKQICLDGFFAKNNLVDKDQLLKYINNETHSLMFVDPSQYGVNNLFLSYLFTLETFINYWQRYA